MKKNFRRITAMTTAIITASCLMMPMSFTASAAGSITIDNDATGHTYEAYQIFDGDLSNSGVLSNIVWGADITDGDGLLSAVKGITLTDSSKPFSDCADASAVAGVLAGITTHDAEITQAFAEEVGKYVDTTPQGSDNSVPYEITGLDDGYYLVKDKDDSLNGAEDSYTRYIVRVLGTATDIEPKDGELPTFVKQVKDANDTEGTVSSFQDSADHDIGDEVEFQLTGTLPENYADYNAYNYIIHDTLSPGLTFDDTSVAVTVDGNTFDAVNYSVNTPGTDGATFDIVFSNLKNFNTITKDSVIVVTYKAELNGNAVMGTAGNPNTAKLEYSNNPNDDGTDTGVTPEDKVVVFTYNTIINKVDTSGNAVENAEFTLQKKLPNDSWEDIAVVKNAAGTTFTFNGLDDGQYKLKETVTPDGYNSISDIYFEISAAHDTTSEDPQLTGLTGTAIDASGNTVSPATITFTPVLADGSLEADVINKKGSELPSTGGSGTTVFYVGGGALVAVAGVFLIAKRRMSSK